MNEIKFIDLFGGIGGFRCGLERTNYYKSTTEKWKSEKRGNRDIDKQKHKFHSGSTPTPSCIRSTQQKNSEEHIDSENKLDNRKFFNCVWYCDKDKYATQTYNKNFKEKHKPTDIAAVNPTDIPDFDMLCAGFPCQSFSVAGKRKGFQDIRGTMFFEICRIASEKRPRLLFLENVKGLLSADDGRCFGTILSSLDELGYDVEWQVLNSKNFGVPQNRERVFIIGHLRGTSPGQVFPLRQNDEIYSREKASQSSHLKSPLRSRGDKPMIMEHKKITERTGKYGTGFKEEGSFCLDSSSGSDLIIHPHIRRLTPVECERLQGFPDGWTRGVSDTQRYKQLGNAVTVNVIQAIGEQVK